MGFRITQKLDITVITGGLGRSYVGKKLQTKDHYFQLWDCERSEWCAVAYGVGATVTFKHCENKILYGVEYDQDERKFKTFEHDETFAPFGERVVMNNGMTEEDADELCWKYNHVGL